MKILFDFLPILLFFIAYKFYGIYIATGVAIAASILQTSLYWIKHRKIEAMPLITLVLIVLLGGATLVLHNELFIKWKPTAIDWAFALVFLVSQFIGSKSITQRMLEKNVHLPSAIWTRLNASWIIFFTLMGLANLYVAYHFDTNTWVNFKLFGMVGLTLVFIIFQALYMARYVDHENSPHSR
jgi:intracellular septation protein